jgi:hypothetical protein
MLSTPGGALDGCCYCCCCYCCCCCCCRCYCCRCSQHLLRRPSLAFALSPLLALCASPPRTALAPLLFRLGVFGGLPWYHAADLSCLVPILLASQAPLRRAELSASLASPSTRNAPLPARRLPPTAYRLPPPAAYSVSYCCVSPAHPPASLQPSQPASAACTHSHSVFRPSRRRARLTLPSASSRRTGPNSTIPCASQACRPSVCAVVRHSRGVVCCDERTLQLPVSGGPARPLPRLTT